MGRMFGSERTGFLAAAITCMALALSAVEAVAGATKDDPEEVFASADAPKFSLRRPAKDWSFEDVAGKRSARIDRIDAERRKVEEEQKTVAEWADSDEKKKKLEELKKEDERLAKLRKDAETSSLRCRLLHDGKGKLESLGTLDELPADYIDATVPGRLSWNLSVTERVGFKFKSTAPALRFRCNIDGSPIDPKHIYVGAKSFHPAGPEFLLANAKKDPGGAQTLAGKPAALGAELPAYYGIWKEGDVWTLVIYRSGDEAAQFEGAVEIPETASIEVHAYKIADPGATLDKIRAQFETDLKKADAGAKFEAPEPFKAFDADAIRWRYQAKLDGARLEMAFVHLFKRGGELVELRVLAPPETFKKDSDLRKDVGVLLKGLKVTW